MNDNTILSLAFPGRSSRPGRSLYNLIIESIEDYMTLDGQPDRIRDIDGYLQVAGFHGTPLNTIAAPVGMVFKGEVKLGKNIFNAMARLHPTMTLENSFLLGKNQSTFRKAFMEMLTKNFNQEVLDPNVLNAMISPRFWIEDESLPEGFFIHEDISDFEIIERFEMKFTNVRLDIRKPELRLEYVIRVNWDNLVLDSEPLD
jgi:hypothetical protein